MEQARGEGILREVIGVREKVRSWGENHLGQERELGHGGRTTGPDAKEVACQFALFYPTGHDR